MVVLDPRNPASDPDLGPWERWTTDWNGEPIIEFDSEAHAEWCEKWAPPCPDGNPQLPRRALAYRERNVGELELRVPLGGEDLGVCQIVVDERESEIYIRVVVCVEFDDDDDAPNSREYTDCPVRVWLERPVGNRSVIDVQTGEKLPLHIPLRIRNDLDDAA